MARIKYNTPIDEIAGSIGGTTFQANLYGFSVKRKPVPTLPNLPRQNSRKTAITIVAQNWIGLSSANKANWDTYAAAFPRPTRLDPSVDLNGFNFFCAVHLLAIQALPAILNNPSGAQSTLTFLTTTITQVGAVLTWFTTFTSSAGTYLTHLYASRPISATSPIKRNKLRWIRAGVQSSNFNLPFQTPYNLIFDEIPVVGDIIFVQEIFQRTTNGQIFEGAIQRITVT